jgi:hypothetical protein
MRKKFPSATLILALLFSAVAGTLFSNLSWADPYVYVGDVPPKPDTIPPKISIFSPKNNAAYNTNYIAFTFNVSEPTGPTVNSPIVDEIYYKADWQQNQVTIYAYTSDPYSGHPTNGEYAKYSVNLNLTGIPKGNHSITVIAGYHGWYIPGNDPHTLSMNGFSISGSSIVNFTIDTTLDLTPPKISILSLENKTYHSPDVPLSFEVSESISQITFSLDGQKNVTITGNTTLTGLLNGLHNVTIYAWDIAGNAGASEAISFTVAASLEPEQEQEPFPTTLVIASAVTVAVIGVGLLVCFKKRNHAEINKHSEIEQSST